MHISASFLGLMSCLVLGGLACGELSSTLEPDEVSIDEIITLTSVSDGRIRRNAVVTLEARIPVGSSETNVTFTTTDGAFLESASKTLLTRAAQDVSNAPALVARADLKVPADTGMIHVRATIKTYFASMTLRVEE